MPESLSTKRSLVLRVTKTFVFVALLFVPTGLVLYFLEHDIIALVLAATLCVWTVGSFLIGLYLSMKIRRIEGFQLVPPDSQDSVTPLRPVLVVLTAPPFTLLPGFSLEVAPRYVHGRVVFPRCLLFGGSLEPRRIPISLRFPHRGVWATESAQMTLRDPLGFFVYRWESPLSSQCTVEPPPAAGRMFPILTSTHRPGDDLTDVENREGELYDLKQYDPADGARKIVWKVFARRRELIARHPEAAMSPEGRVVLYAMLDRSDDIAAGEVLHYLNRLRDLGLEIFFLCAGAGPQSPARTPSRSLDLLIETVWNADLQHTAKRCAEVEGLIASALGDTSESELSRVIIFTSESTFHSQRGATLVREISKIVESKNAAPTFFTAIDHAQGQRSHETPPLISRFLFDTTSEQMAPHTPRRRPEPTQANQWEVVSL